MEQSGACNNDLSLNTLEKETEKRICSSTDEQRRFDATIQHEG